MSVGSDASDNAVSPKKRILVVDDSIVMRKAVEIALRKDYELVEAGDGQAGWEELKASKNIDLVISDIQMPVMDGYNMLCRIRAADNPKISEIPVVVITGAEDEITKERAYACGANDFIVKPIDSAQLVAAIKAHTGVESSDLASHGLDPLTQIANRDHFMSSGKRLLEQSNQNSEVVSLLILEIDNFDQIRQQHGDDFADRVLIWVANILLSKVRSEDQLGQVAKSKFGVLSSSAGQTGASVLCDRIRGAVSMEHFQYDGMAIPITLSIGVAFSENDGSVSMDGLMDFATQRVAAARSRGGNHQVGRAGPLPESVEEAVLAAPDANTALEIIAGDNSGECDPYLIDLALQILPLLERCDKVFDLKLDYYIDAIREQLKQAQ